MKILSRATLIIVVVLTFTLGGCVNNQPANVANNNSTANTTASATPQSTPQTTSAKDDNSLPVTLPVLDAFFADQAFAAELSSKLKLTEEQIEKLRKTAREETSKLRETDSGEYSGTTTAASSRASEQIKSIIGDEKAQQLYALVRQRWSGANDVGAEANDSNNDAAHGTNAKFNAVPTDSRIVVNIPAYRMDVFERGMLTKSYKIGIGYPEFPLPTGMRKANSIVFNPTWTPPDEPWVESANKVKPGEKIEAGSKLNPLGPIKIPIGLPSLIHGGKSPAKLGGFASHGCVGLTTPQVQDFARILAGLSGTELASEQITAFAKTPTETKTVKLNHPVTVELRYETIIVEDGKLHIYRDVYDRDTNTEENVRAVLSTYGVRLEQLSEQERTQILDALKEMSRDAQGRSDEAKTDSNSNAASKNANKKAQDASGKVTRTVKGRKEIVIELPALKGKGYPAPVDFDTGSGAKKAATTSTKGKR